MVTSPIRTYQDVLSGVRDIKVTSPIPTHQDILSGVQWEQLSAWQALQECGAGNPSHPTVWQQYQLPQPTPRWVRNSGVREIKVTSPIPTHQDILSGVQWEQLSTWQALQECGAGNPSHPTVWQQYQLPQVPTNTKMGKKLWCPRDQGH